jgi:glycosyltransferase involved in cell wall biosynthesis
MVDGPLVSILVTVYNRAKYLPECLESILESEFADFEIVVVDDGSTDASFDIATDYATRDRRIRVFQNPSNLGDYPNRMRAAELAEGRFLKYVDSDDLIYPHTLGVMVKAMEAEPDVALGLCHSLAEDEEPYPWKLTPSETWRKHFFGSGSLGCGPTGAIIRRDAFADVGGFREWGVLNDTDLWYRLSARWPLILFPPGLVWWRRHAGQEFAQHDASIAYLRDGYALAVDALSSQSSPLAHSERESALERLRQHHARRLLSLALKSHRPGLALNLWREAKLPASFVFRGLRPYA